MPFLFFTVFPSFVARKGVREVVVICFLFFFMSAMSKVDVEINDVNDNVPVKIINSFSTPITEDFPPENMIAMINIKYLYLEKSKKSELQNYTS